MKVKFKKRNYTVEESMVHLEDYVSRKVTYFKTIDEAEDFYEQRKEDIEKEILATDAFRGYKYSDFNVAEFEKELDCYKVVLIFNKEQTESIFTMGIREAIC